VKTHELRKQFLDYFVEQGHLLVPSASLVPYRDPSVLLTTAGMQPFKPYFLGMADPPARRMTSVQKCFRTTDIDRVGFTGRHCTFFEMLGNFSVGDYFKEGAIRFGYEFSTQHLGLDRDRIWVSVFEGDDQVEPDEEAMGHWEAMGVPRERMVKLPRSENFWGPPGPTGPCGPCSELYFDRGPEFGCDSEDCRPGCDCDRFLEYWNLVFMQYNMDDAKQLTPLPARNIDTGMGLERIAALMQGAPTVFYTDVFYPLIELGQELSGHRFGDDERADVALRVLADHSRATCFLIADGVLPSNEGRGYVLRRIIRRAARFSRNADMQPPFLGRFAERAIEMLADAYPELHQRRESILRVVNSEEERFNRTLDQGLVLLEDEIRRARESGAVALPGTVAFVLHDTYGFPVEVTREVVAERGLSLDDDQFDTAMEEQRQRARATRGSDDIEQAIIQFAREAEHPTEFVGHEKDEMFTVVGKVKPLSEDRILLSLRESPFYAEGGGQSADIGWVEGDTGRAEVLDVQHQGAVQVIHARVTKGRIEAGTRVKAAISTVHRHSVAANHTGTHLLHYALRSTVGKDATQAGSAVRADKFRFDFAFHEPLGQQRLAELEEIVNRKIVENHPVRAFTTTMDHARDLGAMALFGEKYGDFVRVVEIDDFSRELCGGTHVGSTSEIGIFKILSEASVGANVRRIEAVTGRRAVEYYRHRDELLTQAAVAAGAAQEEAIVGGIEKLRLQTAGLKQELAVLLSGKAVDIVRDVADGATEIAGVRVAVAAVEARDADQLVSVLDHVRDKLGSAVVALGAVIDGKATLVVAVSKGLTSVDAGLLVKTGAGVFGGGGGGSATLGRAGGGDPAHLDAALAAVRTSAEEALGG
jgi:alanyl-tRNA synthetase